MRYGVFGADGRLDSAHNDTTITELPTGAELLTEEQWHQRWDLRKLGGEVISDPVVQPLVERQEKAWKQIKAERDRRTEIGGYQIAVDGAVKWFHSDQKSRSQQLGLVLLGANIPSGLQWKTMDGSVVAMTPTLAQQILSAAAASDQEIFAVAEQHRTAMEKSADPAAYDYTGGWPQTYAEWAAA